MSRVKYLLVACLSAFGLLAGLTWGVQAASARQVGVGDACAATPDDGTTVFSGDTAASVQQAVDAAVDGGVVKVAGHCVGVTVHDGISQTVRITKSLTMVGGYTVTNWLTPDMSAHPTVLDADRQGQVVRVGAGVTVSLEALTLQNGFADGFSGGAIYVGGTMTDMVQLDVTNLVITNNRAQILMDPTGRLGRGGAIFAEGAHMRVYTTTMLYNSSSESGGAVFLPSAPGSLTLLDSVVYSNTADGAGGGIYAAQPVQMINTLVAHNRALGLGAGAEDRGGGIVNVTQLHIANSAVINNQAAGNGGGLQLGSEAVVLNSIVAGNIGNGVLDNCHDEVVNPTYLYAGPSYNVSDTDEDDCVGLNPDREDKLGRDPLITMDVNGADVGYMLNPIGPAVNGGNPTGCVAETLVPNTPLFSDGYAVTADQTGAQRDGVCDVGPIEYTETIIACGVMAGQSYLFGTPPLTVTVDTAGSIGCLDVVPVADNHLQATAAQQTGRYWRVAATGTDYELTVEMPVEAAVAEPQACRYTGLGTIWDCGRTMTTTNTVSRAPVTAPADWTVGDLSCGVDSLTATPIVSGSLSVDNLIIDLPADDVELRFGPAAYFDPDGVIERMLFAGPDSYDAGTVTGSTLFYAVRSVNGCATADSDPARGGAFSFSITPGDDS